MSPERQLPLGDDRQEPLKLPQESYAIKLTVTYFQGHQRCLGLSHYKPGAIEGAWLPVIPQILWNTKLKIYHSHTIKK